MSEAEDIAAQQRPPPRYSFRPRVNNLRTDARKAFFAAKMAKIMSESSSDDADYNFEAERKLEEKEEIRRFVHEAKEVDGFIEAPASDSEGGLFSPEDFDPEEYEDDEEVDDAALNPKRESRNSRRKRYIDRRSAPSRSRSPTPVSRTTPHRKRDRGAEDGDIIDQVLAEADELDEHGNLRDLVVPDNLKDDIYESLKSKQEEDWILDTALLGTVIEKKVISKFPVLADESNKLHTTIIEALAEADAGIVEQYVGTKPNDTIWKLLLPAEKIAELEPRLKEARDVIETETPTLVRILETNMSPTDRKKLIQLFDIYKNMEPYTGEEYEMRDRINSSLKAVCKNVDERREADNEERRIMSTAASLHSDSFKTRIISLRTDDIRKRRMLEVLQELEEIPRSSTMYRTCKEKLEWMVSLPYDNIHPLEVEYGRSTAAEINAFCTKVRDRLDNDPDIGLFGLQAAKDEVIAALNNRITNPRSNIMLCLHGGPGCGKTALASAVASAIGLPFERVPLGGVTDPCYLLGSDAHYLGSSPGICLRILKNMKVSNGVVLLDEIDKLDERVQHALLQLTDYTSNQDFRDKYLTDYGHDLSNIWFIVTANDLSRLTAPLRDRLNVTEVEKYSNNEMKQICRFYNLPRILKDVNIPKELVSIDDSGASAILSLLGNRIDQEGVRPLQKLVRLIVSRINLLRTTTLEDGTTGSFVSYKIPGFKLPLVVNAEIVHMLIDSSKIRRINSKLDLFYT